MSKKQHTQFTDADFRAELKKLLPGYKWTVAKATHNISEKYATGALSSGFNQLSTLRVNRTTLPFSGNAWYTADAYWHGLRSDRMATGTGHSLAQAVRMMQDECRSKARKYKALHDQVEQASKHTDKEAAP